MNQIINILRFSLPARAAAIFSALFTLVFLGATIAYFVANGFNVINAFVFIAACAALQFACNCIRDLAKQFRKLKNASFFIQKIKPRKRGKATA